MAQAQIYLRLKLKQNGIVTGPATAVGHIGDLMIDSFRWSESIEVGSGGGTLAGGSSLSAKDFEFTMAMSRASPIVMLASMMTDPVLEATLCCRHQNTKKAEDFVKWTLANGVISSYETLGSAEQIVPRDRFTIRFRTVSLDYRVVGADGTLGTTISVQYDFGTMSSSASSGGSSGGGSSGGGSSGGGSSGGGGSGGGGGAGGRGGGRGR